MLKILGDNMRLCQLVWTLANLRYFLSTGGLFLGIKAFCMMLTCSFRRKKKWENSRGGINLNESALLIRSSEAQTKKLAKWLLKWLKLITASGKSLALRQGTLHLLLQSNPACQVFILEHPSLLYFLFPSTAHVSQVGCLMLLGRGGGEPFTSCSVPCYPTAQEPCS